MANITPFNFGTHTVRVVTNNNQPWFVATDVATTLGYRNAPDASRHLDNDEKGTQIVRTPGGDQKLTIISESGLYALVLRSRKPEARKFAKWVAREVLPSIRQTGHYGQPTQDHKRIEHARQLAHAATAQVYQAVFDAALNSDSSPYNVRLLLSIYDNSNTPIAHAKALEDGAFAMTLPQLTKAIRTDLMVPDTALANLAAACTQRMAEQAEIEAHRSARAQSQGQRQIQ